MWRNGLITITLLSLISCASPRVVQKTEVPSIPETLLMMPKFPPIPAVPTPPRSNWQMYEYRKELEHTVRLLEQVLCEMLNRNSEIVRFATIGQQSVEVPGRCQ